MTQSHATVRTTRSRRWVLWVGGGALVALGAAYLTGYLLAGDNTPRNAAVSGVPVGGLSAEAATAKLKAELGPRVTRPLTVVAGEHRLQTTASTLGLDVDYAASLAETGVGRSWHPVHILTVLSGGSDRPAVVTRDEPALTAAVAGLADDADVVPVDAGLAVKKVSVVRKIGRAHV